MGHGSVAMVTVSTSLVFAKFIASVIFCKKKLHIKFIFNHFDFSVFKEIGWFTFFIFLNQMIDKINWSLDKVMLGKLVDIKAVAVYGIGSNILLMYQNFCKAIAGVFVPKVNRLAVRESTNLQLTQVFTKVGRIQFFIAFLIVSGYIFFGRDFINLWAGKGYEESYLVGIMLIVPATMELIQFLGIEIQRAKNKHRARSVVYTLISVGNIAISIPLIKKFGPVGAATGTAIALFLGNWLFMNYYYHKKIGINIFYYWKNIFKIFPSLIPSLVAGVLIMKFVDTSTWFKLILFIAVYSLIYGVSVLLAGFNTEEKEMLKSTANKFIKIKKVG